MDIEHALEICALKSKARRLYLYVQRRVSSMDCGASLQDHIDPSIATACREFNDTVERLAVIDPEAAKVWASQGPLS